MQDKIKFLKLLEVNPFKFDVISYITKLPTEFKLEQYIDYETQFEKTFLDPMRFILRSPTVETRTKAKSLGAFDDNYYINLLYLTLFYHLSLCSFMRFKLFLN